MVLIGIAGRSGSGKTRVAAELARLSPRAGVLATDSYYHDLSALTPAARGAVNFDAPAALDWELLIEHLSRLHTGVSAPVPHYDFATHTRMPETVPLAPGGLLVLEGLFALFDQRVRAMLNLTVFLDLDEDEGLRRRIERDTGSRRRTEAFVRSQWERDVAPMYALHVLPTKSYADLVLDGASSPADSARAILSAVESLATAFEQR